MRPCGRTLPSFRQRIVRIADPCSSFEFTRLSRDWSLPLPSQPPHINNRVVLHLLEALQILRTKLPGGGPAEARKLSFRSLDIEQIGHVYEGLLDHTARRASSITLGLEGSAKSPAPLITLGDLEALAAKGSEALLDHLEELTGRSRTALEKALGFRAAKRRGKKGGATAEADASTSLIPDPASQADGHLLAVACGHDPRLIARVRPYSGLIRQDSFGKPLLIAEQSLHVAPGNDRRSSGTHYTPRSLTEPLVQHTLEPLVYMGPADGKLQSEWQLRTPAELLALKVCDMAMGSGAFLVQTCRYLAERLVEAWEALEKAHPGQVLATQYLPLPRVAYPPPASPSACCQPILPNALPLHGVM
ncbi:MAG TPA: hypothetical protein VD994_19390 [Prosthecobacter sp.]|nr:hypothetical protein [Prosthecobacter sp.]